MSIKPLVSVCICTYNSSEYIIQTLNTVIFQTYKNMEILICDNWSTDWTVELIKKLHDPRIVVYEMWKNIGAYDWLNFLMRSAKWKYIAIQDHDDLWKLTKIEKQVAFLEENQKYVGCWTVSCMWYEWDNKCFYYDFGRETYWVIHPSLMFRNVWKYYIQEKEYMADCYFMKKILCGWKKLMYNLPECLTIHRIKMKLDNYSYSRFKFNWTNIKTVFYCHNPLYACLMIWFELCRKLFYPFMSLKSRYKFERLPFILKWYKIVDYVKS